MRQNLEAPPWGESVARTLEQLAVDFGRRLREGGIRLPVDSVITFARGLSVITPLSSSAIYWTGRVCLIRRREDVATYDRAFVAFWLGREETTRVPLVLQPLPAEQPDTETEPDDRAGAEAALSLRYSAEELLRHKDFATCTEEELAQIARLIAQLGSTRARRRSRRLTHSKKRHGKPDLRRMIRRAYGTGGVPIRRAFRQPRVRQRRLVLIGDVSASMEDYGRPMLRFLHAAVAARPRGQVEAFALGTRLTRLTRELEGPDPDRVFRRVATSVEDRAGGTRLGTGLHAFNARYGSPGMARGANVVIFSDGWDRGDPVLLAGAMARLHRLAHRVIWVNPLKASPGYEPLARGMAAALPHVDAFLEGHSVAALEELAEVLER